MNLFLIWASGSGGDVLKKISYLELWWPFSSAERNHLCNFSIHVKLYEIWTSGSVADAVKRKSLLVRIQVR